MLLGGQSRLVSEMPFFFKHREIIFLEIISTADPKSSRANKYTKWKPHLRWPQKRWGRSISPSTIINRPGVAGTVLQTPSSLSQSVSQSVFSSEPSTHHYTQTGRARELKFWKNVFPPLRVTCHVSCVRCQVSGVTCPFFMEKVVEPVGGGSVINGAYPV